ncbi:DUF935 family protein [Aneurinibacillus sp. Ricciae_BoGa-3]|uniref:phage portal protein family protein n=1 Tax=Aneurinibacillus sp. Ricciae_BoGa-3 TaxID=3022697 RepID=UPI0023421AEE|nr:DUF935 family protein [Aneurinibacillus sp. Ricciae_BoGa-3]WCK55421.1 DUF935 family protein [Aneurinibacillus sp. Ricciae_BoGa-3]
MEETYRPQIGQIGSQLYTTFFLFNNCISNPDDVSVFEYERMLDTDETIAVGIQFLISSVLMKLGEYQNESNPKIANFVNECFESMKGNLHTAVEEMLSALWAGYSGTEIIWKPDGNRIVIEKLATYHPYTVYIKVDPMTGEYQGFSQWRRYAGSPVDIPPEKAILYTYNKRFGNHYGKSILKPLRKNWLLKDPILKMWARALDRFGTPLIALYLPDELADDPDNPGHQVTQMELGERILRNLQNGTGITLRSDPNNASKAEAVTNVGSGVGDAFEKAVQYFNKMILRGMLVPALVFDEGQRSGSYALGQSHFGIFNLGVTGIYGGVTETLIEQLIKPLVDYNFGPQKNYGQFVENEIESEDMKLLVDGFLSLTNGGYLDPQIQEDFDEVRMKMGLPQRKVVTPDEKVAAVAEDTYARYTQDGGVIGDPLAQKDDAGPHETGQTDAKTA